MTPTNLLFILSDEHDRRVTGCYGHPMIRKPNLDALARRGARFTSAYTKLSDLRACPRELRDRPVCPSGALLGQRDRLRGAAGSWGHWLREQRHHVAAIGKLNY